METSIKATDLELTPALKKYAQDKINSLVKFLPGLTHAWVELQRTTKHHHKGEVWRAEANLHAPQHLIRAEAKATDIYAAIDLMKDGLRRELKSLKDKRTSALRGARRSESRNR